MATPVMIDCDPGNGIPGADIDDGIALALALRSPEVTVRAVTVVAGNVPLDDGVRAALTLLHHAGTDVPVHAGARRPLAEPPEPWRAELDGRRDHPVVRDLWADLWPELPMPEMSLTPHSTDAASALARCAADRPGELTVVAVGPLTNVARALLLDPDFANNVAHIVVMGGSFGTPDVLQELNFGYDPEAAHLVLTCGAPITLVPLDLTERTCFRERDAETLASNGSALGRHVASTVRPWVKLISAMTGRDGCALHDPVAVAAVVAPHLVQTRTACVDVELAGSLTRGKPVSWDPTSQHALRNGLRLPTVQPIRIATAVDNDALVELILSRLADLG